jgi:hypothetical protein
MSFPAPGGLTYGCSGWDREAMNPPRGEIVDANGVDLCVESFGDSADPAILLIMGSSASMDWWEDEFCARLAAGSRFVIRYDQRDTGRSVSYEPGVPGYTFDDLVADRTIPTCPQCRRRQSRGSRKRRSPSGPTGRP